jgi:ADP-ribose pyrophosphatase
VAKPKPPSSDHQVEILSRERVYQGFFKLARFRLRHTLFEGGWSPELVRERLEELRAASVLLYDADRDTVVLIEQFRIGALDHPAGAWVLETIGGYVGEGESSEQVARREAVEEAGCAIGEVIPICELMVSPGLSVERISLYLGLVDSEGAGGVHGLDHEGEDIRVQVMPADAAIAELYTGRANSTSIIIALQWLAMNRERLQRSKWAQRTTK